MDKGTGLLRPVILFFALVLFSEGRVVEVPVGPLVHVEGQAVSIRCNVSNYEGPRQQDFDWFMLQAGGKLLNLISTLDESFMDSSVRDRVNSGDISYEMLADNSVELRFKKVRATDSGVYRCSTPSTDSVISGNYHADVELKEEAEFRLVSLMPDYTDQPDVQYMQKTESNRPSKSVRDQHKNKLQVSKVT